MSHITLDGSIGEGGGQILRTALGLSARTGQAFRIERIRAGRDRPGLLRQHLTAVNAAAEICDAKVEGAALGSQAITFVPGPVKPGDYAFAIGSAGSTTLVLQTVLPALITSPTSSMLTVDGGTHNPFAPPVDFLRETFLPLVNRMGADVSVQLDRPGFYPAGGGRIRVTVGPAKRLDPLHIPAERGEITRRHAKATVAALPGSIALRELGLVEQHLHWADDQLQVEQLASERGLGNVLTLTVASAHVTEVFTGFGTKGVSAEAVADHVIRDLRRYLADGAPVGAHLADQLLIPMAIAGGGSFVTQALTPHTTTNAEVIQQFLPGVNVTFRSLSDKQCEVTVRS